jgi:RNA polymerase sporulation-specific sigma factor
VARHAASRLSVYWQELAEGVWGMDYDLLLFLLVPLLRGLWLLLGYLTGNAFPQPLSEQEEAACLERMRHGDTKARRTLIEHNLRLVAHIVKKFDNTGEDADDLISIGAVGLIKAIDTYDPSKGTRLATYAARCVENEILMFLRAAKRTRGEVSLYDPIGVDREGNEITLIDVLGSDPDAVHEQVAADVEMENLLRKLRYLDHKERTVLEMRFGLAGGRRRTQREVAKALGISRSYVSRIEKRAVSKLTRDIQGGLGRA